MIYVENRKPTTPIPYDGSFAQEIGVDEDKYYQNLSSRGSELYQLLGYTGVEWRLKMQNEHIGDAMWEDAAFEHTWSEFDTVGI